MASINPSSLSNKADPHGGKSSYTKLTITKITQTGGATNQTTVDWKITVEGTPYVYLYALYVSLGGVTLYDHHTGGAILTSWSAGQVIASGSTTFNNNSDGSLTLNAYIKQMFFYGNGDTSRWTNPYYYQENSTNMVCSTIPRYANITSFGVAKRDETSVTYTYSADATLDWARYSLDNVNWYDLPSNNIVSGLSPNTTYTFYLALRRKDSGLWSYSGGVNQTTYDYPHCTNTPDFVIGDPMKLTLYNPLGRSTYVKVMGENNVAIYDGMDIWAGTSVGSFNTVEIIDHLYKSIPNAPSGRYTVTVTYGSSVRTKAGGTYTIRGTETPIYNNFLYEDTNTAVTNVTGNNQILVKGLSSIRVTIPSANNMVPVRYANPKNYTISMDNLNTSVDYSANGVMVLLGTLNSSGTKRLNVRAYDSRNLSTLAYQDITVYDYAKPVVNASITRLNNFENQTTIKVSGTYTRLTIDGADKNTITNIQYRYRESGGTWSNWTTLSTTVTSGKFTCSDVILSLDNTKSFEFEIQAVDKLQTNTATKTLDIGQAIFFISSNNKKCYINGQEIIMYDVVDEW